MTKMLSEEKLNRINELAKRKKRKINSNGRKEQQLLRQEYLEAFRGGMRNHRRIKIVDEEGNDVTPDKLKAIQKKKKDCITATLNR